MDTCPKCKCNEVEANDFRTHYECGSWSLDGRIDKFRQSKKCQTMEIIISWIDCIEKSESVKDTIWIDDHTTLVEDMQLFIQQIKETA